MKISHLLLSVAMTSFLQAEPWSTLKSARMQCLAQTHFQSDCASYPTYPFPASAHQILKPNQSLPVFAYGSLLNRQSASKTLNSNVIDNYKPALAFGIKRLFNRYEPRLTHWGPPMRHTDKAYLNIDLTGNMNDTVNGVLFEADLEALQSLIKREEGYDLIPVPIILWEEAIDPYIESPKVIIAYTFHASHQVRQGRVYTSQSVTPIPGYAIASMNGAEQFGEPFLNYWKQTTFLSDTITPFPLWLANPHIDYGVKMVESKSSK